MSDAEHMMRVFNGNALIGFDEFSGEYVMIEDILIPDASSGSDLTFRLEYRSDEFGNNARAWLLHNPVSLINDRDYHRTHLSDNGFICYGLYLSESESPYDLALAIPRVRLWCAGYTLHQQLGFETVCQLIPGWRGTS